jgi:hypothetical protein
MHAGLSRDFRSSKMSPKRDTTPTRAKPLELARNREKSREIARTRENPAAARRPPATP